MASTRYGKSAVNQATLPAEWTPFTTHSQTRNQANARQPASGQTIAPGCAMPGCCGHCVVSSQLHEALPCARQRSVSTSQNSSEPPCWSSHGSGKAILRKKYQSDQATTTL
eukprot:scaffold17572_cov32-Tisochrysis_lutea.AAC.9